MRIVQSSVVGAYALEFHIYRAGSSAPHNNGLQIDAARGVVCVNVVPPFYHANATTCCATEAGVMRKNQRHKYIVIQAIIFVTYFLFI